MKKNKLLIIPLFFTTLYANNLAYNSTSSILELPNSKISEDFTGSFFISKQKDILSSGLNFTFLPKLETSFSIKKTDTSNKKNIDLKLLLSKETEFLPSFIYGLNDIWGDSTYSSKYLAFGKKIGYFDTTLGYIKGRASGDTSNIGQNSYKYLMDSSWRDGDVFITSEFLYSKRFSLLADFKDSKLNFGLKFISNKNIVATVFLEDSKDLSFALSYNFDLKNKKKLDKKVLSYKTSKLNANKNIKSIKRSYIYDLENLNASIEEVFNRDKDFEYINYTLEDKEFNLHKNEYLLYQNDTISNTYMKNALSIKRVKEEKEKNTYEFYFTPKLKTYVENDNKISTSKLSLLANANYNFQKESSLKATVNIPLFNQIKNSSDNEILAYDKKNKASLDNLFLSYTNSYRKNEYLNFDLGYLNSIYSGINLEYQKIFDNDSYAMSLQYQYAKKRDIDSIFSLESKIYDAKFLNFYYLLSNKKNTHLGLKLGEFLEGDRGYRIDFTRSYKSYIFGIYASKTKLDNIDDKKGFYIKIPFFCDISKSQRRANIDVESISNKKAMYIDFDNSLYNKLSNENNIQLIRKNINRLYNH